MTLNETEPTPSPQSEETTTPQETTQETTTEESPSLVKPAEKASEEAPSISPEDIITSLKETFEFEEDEGISEFASVLAKHKVGAEVGKDLLNLYAQYEAKAEQATATAWAEQNSKWQTAAKNDPVIGGEHFDRNLGQINELVGRFGDKEVFEALSFTGAGNHPAILRMLHNIAKEVVQEAAPAQGAPRSTDLSLADKLFKGAS